MYLQKWPSCCVVLFVLFATTNSADDDYNNLNPDGSFDFGYNNRDSYHHAAGNRNNVVRGEFGGYNPAKGRISSTEYTAGPRGYRPRGEDIHRKYDLNQNGPRPIGSPDDPYFDPYEDPSYSFGFKTRTYNRQENANRFGDVTGKYNYVDDVGEVHNVEYIAGKNTGFHVKTPFPDSNPNAYYGRLFFRGRGKPIPRGRTSIQRGLDGSYRFVSAGPDQRRTEISDGSGHVRGSYTYLDDKGVQHSVHYIAGPETGYKVLKNVKGPHLPTVYPFGGGNIVPPDFYDPDLFDTAASGHVKPPLNKPSLPDNDNDDDSSSTSGVIRPTTSRPFGSGGSSSTNRPGADFGDGDDYGGDDFEGELFGPSGGGGSRPRPTSKPGGADDGSYIPPGDPNQDDGSYKPDDAGLDERPRPGGLGRPTSRPDPSGDYDDGLFVKPRPPPVGGKPVIQIQGNGGCKDCPGTVVTNVGDRLFSVPPGVSVRAHVQSIDLLPLASKIPSPSDQYNEEMNIKTEQLNSAASTWVTNSNNTNIESGTTVAPPTTTDVNAETTTVDDE